MKHKKNLKVRRAAALKTGGGLPDQPFAKCKLKNASGESIHYGRHVGYPNVNGLPPSRVDRTLVDVDNPSSPPPPYPMILPGRDRSETYTTVAGVRSIAQHLRTAGDPTIHSSNPISSSSGKQIKEAEVTLQFKNSLGQYVCTFLLTLVNEDNTPAGTETIDVTF